MSGPRVSAADEPRERSEPRPQRSERRSASAAEGASRGAGVPGDSLKRRASERVGGAGGAQPTTATRVSAANEPRERSEPAKRRASERVGGAGGAKPPGGMIDTHQHYWR